MQGKRFTKVQFGKSSEKRNGARMRNIKTRMELSQHSLCRAAVEKLKCMLLLHLTFSMPKKLK
jgi:hypothetical protein